MGFPSVSSVKNPPATQETQVGSLEGMATHSSILTWRILCTEEPARLDLDMIKHRCTVFGVGEEVLM